MCHKEFKQLYNHTNKHVDTLVPQLLSSWIYQPSTFNTEWDDEMFSDSPVVTNSQLQQPPDSFNAAI